MPRRERVRHVPCGVKQHADTATVIMLTEYNTDLATLACRARRFICAHAGDKHRGGKEKECDARHGREDRLGGERMR